MKPHRMRMTLWLASTYAGSEAIPGKRRDLCRFHVDDYVSFLRNITTETQQDQLRQLKRFNVGEDCPVFDGLYNFCQTNAGGSVGGAVKLNHGLCDIAINWAGGLHHAKKCEASGFCYVNDIVLAILELLKVHEKICLMPSPENIHQQLAHRLVPDRSWMRTTIEELQTHLFQNVLSITEAIIFHSTTQVMNLISDVKGKVAVMVDDMIDTAGTIAKGAALLHQERARKVYACCTHAVFSPPTIERLSSVLFQEVIITNTIPVSEQNYFNQLTVLSVANLLGEAIWHVHDDCSVSSIFQ